MAKFPSLNLSGFSLLCFPESSETDCFLYLVHKCKLLPTFVVQCIEIGKLCFLPIENDDVMGKTSGIINQNAEVFMP